MLRNLNITVIWYSSKGEENFLRSLLAIFCNGHQALVVHVVKHVRTEERRDNEIVFCRRSL